MLFQMERAQIALLRWFWVQRVAPCEVWYFVERLLSLNVSIMREGELGNNAVDRACQTTDNDHNPDPSTFHNLYAVSRFTSPST